VSDLPFLLFFRFYKDIGTLLLYKADIIADMSLILPTVYVLAAIPKSRCRMPIPVFSSCILPSVVSLIHLALVVTSQGQVASTIALVVKVSTFEGRAHVTVDSLSSLVVCRISCGVQPPDNRQAILCGAKK